MKITIEKNGCSFEFNDIPEIDTEKKLKDYLWTDITTNFLFKSRQDLEENWKVKNEKN